MSRTGGGLTAATTSTGAVTSAPATVSSATTTATGTAATTASASAGTAVTSSAAATAATSSAPAKAGGNVTLHLYVGGDTNIQDLWNNGLLPGWNKANPSMPVQLIFSEHGTGDQAG